MIITSTVILVIIIIFVALAFDFTNGFHDSANSIATVVSTKVLTPKKAVAFAAFFNFIAAFGFGVAVASTISKIIHLGNVAMEIIPYIVLGGLIGAISWNLITWYWGLPSSSSHALIGGMMGAGISAGGLAAIKFETVTLAAMFMILSPLIGLACGFFFMVAVLWICRKTSQSKVDHHFRKLQLVSAALFSFSHGTNDAQKTMGIITPLLFSIGYFSVGVDPNNLPVPIWVILSAHAAIALGTLAGGWRIVRTMGHRITKLRPVHGFAAETASAATIIGASIAGIPVSTTHVISSSIMGVGATKRLSAVRWGVARSIVWVWILTIPISAAIGFIAFYILHFFI
ncbi:MAG: inorganic phosphate transporter [Euryarchaeota archaeon]|nr:inorganic phosphate transporter [Euryarchaeota archaeon]